MTARAPYAWISLSRREPCRRHAPHERRRGPRSGDPRPSGAPRGARPRIPAMIPDRAAHPL